MTKDDKRLRETVLAELRRRHDLAGKDDDRSRRDIGDGGYATREPEAREQLIGQRAATRP